MNIQKDTNKYVINERLPLEELQANLEAYNEIYAGSLVVSKKDNEMYCISHFSVLNHSGKAEYAVNYYPYSSIHDYSKINHTKPAQEFFDGRFSQVDKCQYV